MPAGRCGCSRSLEKAKAQILAQSRCELQSLVAAHKDFHHSFAHSQERDNMLHVLVSLNLVPLGGHGTGHILQAGHVSPVLQNLIREKVVPLVTKWKFELSYPTTT